ncbi:MAG: hypothetical protein P8X88_03680, partial [Gammaproteobacteria bacterium]
MATSQNESVLISQSVAILIDGNNIERSIHSETGDENSMLNFDALIPRLLDNRGLSRQDGLNFQDRGVVIPYNSGCSGCNDEIM